MPITMPRATKDHLRDSSNALARAYDVDLASDGDASQLAALMLDEQTVYRTAEVWDPARLVCTVRREITVIDRKPVIA